jgi:hypothetical protein
MRVVHLCVPPFSLLLPLPSSWQSCISNLLVQRYMLIPHSLKISTDAKASRQRTLNRCKMDSKSEWLFSEIFMLLRFYIKPSRMSGLVYCANGSIETNYHSILQGGGLQRRYSPENSDRCSFVRSQYKLHRMRAPHS